MRHSITIFSVLVLAAPAYAQDPLTFSFGGTVAGGWLDLESISSSGDGYGYDAPVLQLEGRFSADYAVSEDLSAGLIGRISAREGTQARYDAINISFGPQPGRFDKFEIDLATYLSAGPLVLSYGDMESSFSLATLEVDAGNSPIPAGGAVHMNIGGGLGTEGIPLSDTSALDPRFYTSRTTRADLAYGDFLLSISTSLNERGRAKSVGLKWDRDFGEFGVTVGLGYEQGPSRDYRSASAALEYQGFRFVVNEIRQVASFDYNLVYRGYSASYDFGQLDLGIAKARQAPKGFFSVFEGDAKAFWVGWEFDESSRVDFEMSEGDYQSGNDVKSMSLAYSYQF
ncbi:MAG: hypothetical protein JNK19_03705 [Tabrizicola sp.]|nr:hypothetical protein [Tabrizicola sp.]